MNQEAIQIERNQCDGCMQGCAIVLGPIYDTPLHVDRHGRAFMTCQRDKYESVTCLSCGAIRLRHQQCCGH